jgi:hypothetical protein
MLVLKEWRYPRKYRSIIAYNPLGIFQSDIIELYPLWDKIFGVDSQLRQEINPDNYGLICVDVYSRFAWGLSLPRKKKQDIRNGLKQIFSEIGKPDILSGDAEVVNSVYENVKEHKLYPEFRDLTTHKTTPEETNKNAIVERMMRTLKNYILKYLYEHDYPIEKQELITPFNGTFNTSGTDFLIKYACNVNNNRKHRIIKAVPSEVFIGLDTNKQDIVKIDYPLLRQGEIVLKVPTRPHSEVPIKTFEKDYDLYVISEVRGRKYKLIPLYDAIKPPEFEIGRKPGKPKTSRLYQPYEIRKLTVDDIKKHLESPLVLRSLYKKYGEKLYDILEFVKNKLNINLNI